MTALLRSALLVGGIRLADVPTGEEARRLLRHLLERNEEVATFWDRNVAAAEMAPLDDDARDEDVDAMLTDLERELRVA